MYKGKKQGADKGFNLLKKKADALKARLQRMLKEIYQVYDDGFSFSVL